MTLLQILNQFRFCNICHKIRPGQLRNAFISVIHGRITDTIDQLNGSKECVVLQCTSEKSEFNVECFFQKLKWFRRIATRYDTLDSSFLSFVYLASIIILLK